MTTLIREVFKSTFNRELCMSNDFSNYLNDPKGSDEFPVGPARNSTQGCFAHDLHFEDLIDA